MDPVLAWPVPILIAPNAAAAAELQRLPCDVPGEAASPSEAATPSEIAAEYTHQCGRVLHACIQRGSRLLTVPHTAELLDHPTLKTCCAHYEHSGSCSSSCRARLQGCPLSVKPVLSKIMC